MDWRKTQILLVDPDESFANRVGRAFKSTNGRAVLSRARTVAEARALLAAVPPDVVIADLHLPDGTAAEFLDSDGANANYPVIVLVRRGEEQLGAEAVESGAVECFVKDANAVDNLPPVTIRSIREWNHMVERDRAEKTILRLRTQVNQFQRLVASGLMERGVAQDIENLLTPILGFAEVALDKIPPRGEARGEVEQVVRVARFGKDLVRDALNQCKNGGVGRPSADVSGVVRDVLELLRPVAPAGVEIREGESAPGAIVKADRAQVHRLVVNLCMNAFDAMRSSGGILQVDVEINGRRGDGAGSEVRVTFTDTGRGMDPEVRQHVFDPFFTTKPKGEGLGLGLSLAREIVNANNGNITVESEPGKGTVFQVGFPLHEDAGERAGSAGGRAAAAGGGEAGRSGVVL